MTSDNRIKVLPPELANKIAAGEVIQRPASAVKELLENAIDAHATSLTVLVKDSGKQLLQVIDDGDGMTPDDAVLAFQRHATSKISVYDDLLSVRTLGFRGEALASMAAVSQVELRTRREEDETGTMVRLEGGAVTDVRPHAGPRGTSVALKNLFFNTPARRKFLKTPSTEFKHIFDAVQRVAIAYPEIAVTLRSDDEIVLQLRPAEPARRIADVFGEKLASGVFSFGDASGGPVNVSGFLCRPDFARKSRVEQYLFLNRRPIASKSLQHAVFQAYENLLEKGSFPFFVLFLNVDPRSVDVNVHPAKTEVKFEDESSMYRFILSTVRSALSSQNLVPSVAVRQAPVLSPGSPGLRLQSEGGAGGPRARDWDALFIRGREHAAGSAQAPGLFAPGMADRIHEPDPGVSSGSGPGARTTASPTPSGPIWQVHNKYILVSTDQGLLVIDQHAAHERVLYERAVGKFATTHNKSQQLLFPQTLECSAGDAALLQQLMPELESIGFSVRVFGKNAVIIDGVPLDVKPGEEGTILPQILDLFKEDEQSLHLQPREKLAKSYSCKAAIKAGDPLNEAEMRSLIEQLFEAEIPFVCPHGRPVMITLSVSELDKRFGRTS
jgi:DNA mismatch repair protein MutL